MTFNLHILAKKNKLTEAQEQIVFVQWLDIMQIPYYHVPNGGFRTDSEGAKFKRMGVKAGIPDICIVRACGKYHGAYIELKRKGGATSKSQVDWLEILANEGYYVKVAFGADEAMLATKEYLRM